ncbi:MAG: hypothetical protein QOH67_1608 [Hyphomicrobiales bacterium]|nr:hypothetical protein [Hyphomicrobiales bacterium]
MDLRYGHDDRTHSEHNCLLSEHRDTVGGASLLSLTSKPWLKP